MSSTAQKICVDALSLPRKTRAEIAHRLLVSLEEQLPSREVEAAWKTTARKRLANIKSGKTTCRDVKAAVDEARKKLAKNQD
jgi:hypothetical protein